MTMLKRECRFPKTVCYISHPRLTVLLLQILLYGSNFQNVCRSTLLPSGDVLKDSNNVDLLVHYERSWRRWKLRPYLLGLQRNLDLLLDTQYANRSRFHRLGTNKIYCFI